MAIEMSSFVAAPRDRVFAAYTDVDRWAETVEGITKVEKLTDGPVGNGTRFRETRVMFKKEHTEEMEIADFDPPNGYSVLGESCGSAFTSKFTFTEQDGGTRIDMTMTWKSLTFFAKLMSPLGALMSGPMKKAMAKDFADLKSHLEAADPAPEEAAVT